METIIQSLKRIEDKIYTTPYDELSDYLKGIRDIVNLINGEEPSDEVADDIIYAINTAEEKHKQLSKEIKNIYQVIEITDREMATSYFDDKEAARNYFYDKLDIMACRVGRTFSELLDLGLYGEDDERAWITNDNGGFVQYDIYLVEPNS